MVLTIQAVEEQLKNVMGQRDNASNTFQQCAGAIAVLSEQLRMLNIEDESNKVQDNCITDDGDDNVGIEG